MIANSTYTRSCMQSNARSKTSKMRLEGVTSLWQCLAPRCVSFLVVRNICQTLFHLNRSFRSIDFLLFEVQSELFSAL
jgi:hypothetical protein